MNPLAILHAAADVHGFTVADLTGLRKTARLTDAREAVAVICHDQGETFTATSKLLGRKNHACASDLVQRSEIDTSAPRRAQIRAVRELAQARTTPQGETA